MGMVDNQGTLSRYWQSEYDWKAVPAEPSVSDSRTNVVCVLFEAGAQHRFSSVRITFCCDDSIPLDVRDEWQIKLVPSPSLSTSAADRDQDTLAGSDTSSLPAYSVIFVATMGSPSPSESPRDVSPGTHASLRLLEGGSFPGAFFHTLFEFNQLLTEETQSVSIAFTSSRGVSTLVPRDKVPSFDPLVDIPLVVGRVVRVYSLPPSRARRAIALPGDVLLLVFENLFDPTYLYWRKDLVSCALVCHDWIRALDFLWSDFQSKSCQQGYPPDISKLADALAKQPRNGRFIKHLSAQYFEGHSAWDTADHFDLYEEDPDLCSQEHDKRCYKFSCAFLSVLDVAQNLRVLHLDRFELQEDPDSSTLFCQLPALSNLEELAITEQSDLREDEHTLSLAHVLFHLDTWPSLRRITMKHLPPDRKDVDEEEFPPLECSLTEINLAETVVSDDELTHLMSSSSASLKRLVLNQIAGLTNVGFCTLLRSVSKSLTCLCVEVLSAHSIQRGGDSEEHALDAVIAHMERLQELETSQILASNLMIERRSRAFESSTNLVLPEVKLTLTVFECPPLGNDGIIQAAKKHWPGWKITMKSGKRRAYNARPAGLGDIIGNIQLLSSGLF